MVAPSQGVHLVVDREFLGGDTALMVPKTADGRVLFAVPWLGKVILGTTDTPRHDLAREPLAFEEEINFILEESARYLTKAPTRADVKSIWVGLRPLVKPPEEDGGQTKGISREHTIVVSRSGLVTVTGGKWTTYRAMAEDVLARCMADGQVPHRPKGATQSLRLVGARGKAMTGSPLRRHRAPSRMVMSRMRWHRCRARGVLGRRVDRGHGALCRTLRVRGNGGGCIGTPFTAFVPGCQIGATAGRQGRCNTAGGNWLAPEVAAFEALAQQYLLI